MNNIDEQIKKYPMTRYMGSKRKLLEEIWDVSSRFQFDSVIDLFSGSGVVSYMYKTQGKQVISNDYMHMGATISKALIENNKTKLSKKKARELLILKDGEQIDDFVQTTFQGIYYSDDDNYTIDLLRHNIKKIKNSNERAIAMEALIRACTKKRPRGIFTYVGHRYDDGRKDLLKSFEEQFLDAVDDINNAIFDNGKKNVSICGDAMKLRRKADLVYMDPPYYSTSSDNEYVRRYHFVEGLARDWDGVEIQEHTLTKKFKNYPTPFSTKDGAYAAFDKLFYKFRDSILIVSYSSNSLPTMDEMIGLLKKYKQNVEVVDVDYTYTFANKENVNKNKVKEYIFVGY